METFAANGSTESDQILTPDVAEARALALIMAAAVARGEQGHTAALNRVARVLGAPTVPSLSPVSPEVQAHLFEKWERGAVGDLRAELARVEAERDGLRVEVDALKTQRGDRLRDLREALGMPGDAGWGLLLGAVRHLQAEADAVNHLRAAAQKAEDVARLAEQRADRLQAELAEARAALAGKAMHDAAAEVVAPLREALGCDTSGMAPAGVVEAAASIVREALDATPLPSAAREPMTHTSLASIERHGVVFRDKLAWVGRHETGRMVDELRAASMGRQLRTAAGRVVGETFVVSDDFPLTVVEAPDAAD